MLFLQMQLDADRYALDIRQVAEVLPLVDLKAIPGAPAGVVGLIDYGGAPVPVVDLCQLLVSRAAHRRLNTRIILVHYSAGTGKQHLLGLLAERATETVRREPAEFRASGVMRASPPHLGGIALDADGAVHWIDVNRLLPESLCNCLFQPATDS